LPRTLPWSTLLRGLPGVSIRYHMSPSTIEDIYDVIEWLATQPWCDGQVATFGTSYFAMTAKRVAMLKPPSLRTIFAPFGVTDEYRHAVFQGGIFSFRFHKHWLKSLSNLRVRQSFPDKIGRVEFERRIKEVLADPEVLWFVTLFQDDEAAHETILTRGWLRGSQRRVDSAKSTPWSIHHPHDLREPLKPGEIYEFNIEIVPTGVLLKAGMRLGLRTKATDQDAVPTDFIDVHAYGHLWRNTRQTITVYHSNAYPSHLLVPITKGNRVGTFASGGIMPPVLPH
jgi:predicted acyl esterase